MEERRKYPRFSLKHDLEYKICKDNLTSLSGKCVTENVSRGGVCILIKDEKLKGEIVSLNIHNKRHSEEINADAKIVWKSTGENDTNKVGMSFTRIGWTESDKLFD